MTPKWKIFTGMYECNNIFVWTKNCFLSNFFVAGEGLVFAVEKYGFFSCTDSAAVSDTIMLSLIACWVTISELWTCAVHDFHNNSKQMQHFSTYIFLWNCFILWYFFSFFVYFFPYTVYTRHSCFSFIICQRL